MSRILRSTLTARDKSSQRVGASTITDKRTGITTSKQFSPYGYSSSGSSAYMGYLDSSSFMSMLGGLDIPIISNIADALSGNYAQKASMMYNEEQARINRNFTTSEREASQLFYEYMWNKNNEYNSLSAQVKRAEEAGFSANAVLGNQSGSQPISTPQGAVTSAPSVGDLGTDFLNRSLERKLLEAQTDNVKSDTKNKDYQLHWNYKTEDERYNQLVNQNAHLSAETQAILNKIGIDNIDVSIRQGQYRWMSMKSEAELATMWQNLNNLRNENLEILSRIKLNNKQGEYYVSLKGLTDEQIETEGLRQNQIVEETYLTSMQGLGQSLENDLKAVQVSYSNATGLPLGTQQFEMDFYLWATGQQENYYQSLRMRQNDAHAKTTDKKWYNHFLGSNHVNRFKSWANFNKKDKKGNVIY